MVTYLLSSAPRRILAAREPLQHLLLPVNIQLSKNYFCHRAKRCKTLCAHNEQKSYPGRIQIMTTGRCCNRLRQSAFQLWSSFKMVGLGRIELPTSPLSGVRSSQLSYRPTLVANPAAENRRNAATCRAALAGVSGSDPSDFPRKITSAALAGVHARAAPIGGAGRDRTGDLLSANQALSQLSYSP